MKSMDQANCALERQTAYVSAPASRNARSRSRLRDLNVLCWALELVFVWMPEGLLVKDPLQNGYFHSPHVDFAFFYAMGRMFGEYPAEQLYNYELQKKVLMDLRPESASVYTPNPYPPFVGVLFRPFARMSYATALLLWSSISLSLYIAGLVPSSPADSFPVMPCGVPSSSASPFRSTPL